MDPQQTRLVLLAGGVGAAKFVSGLVQTHDPDRIVIISNTGDDIDRHGLWISPDVDTMLYTLAGIVDPVRGWGIQGDTFETLSALARSGEETWFQLGDRDLATHLIRTDLRGKDWTATQITKVLADRLKVKVRVMPMSNDRVMTEVRTPRGWVSFQEYFVKEDCRPEPLDVAFRGSERSAATREVLDALRMADAVVICPSNPIASIGPILSVPGIREFLKPLTVPRIAICPLVGGKSLKGPSDRMMKAGGFAPDVSGVARYYHGLIDALVIDSVDSDFAPDLRREGLAVLVTDTVMDSAERKRSLAKKIQEWVVTLHDQHRHPRQEPVHR